MRMPTCTQTHIYLENNNDNDKSLGEGDEKRKKERKRIRMLMSRQGDTHLESRGYKRIAVILMAALAIEQVPARGSV